MVNSKINSPHLIENIIFDVRGSERCDTMKLHHLATDVPDISEVVGRYSEPLESSIAYVEKAWSILDSNNPAIALLLSSQHPLHVGFCKTRYGKVR